MNGGGEAGPRRDTTGAPADRSGEADDLDNLRLLHHPLLRHKVSLLRDRETGTRLFQEVVDEISALMAYEVFRDLDTEEYALETPLEAAEGHRIAADGITLVPVLRAGLGMVDGVRELVPSARVGHVGLRRDHDTLEPVDYYFKIPPEPERQEFVVLDPMLATGGSASAALDFLEEAGAERARMVCIVAATEGVEKLGREHPDVEVYAAALDRELTDEGYILPGLGDAGDRLFGT